MQSRYYDPAIGRFINADTFTSTGQDLLGNNMFVYCGNNPIMRADLSGMAWYNVVWDWANTLAGTANPISTITALGSLVTAAVNGRWSDIKDDWNNGCLNPLNQSETIATKAKVLGFYKGSAVVHQNIIGTCSIGGTIWAESDMSETTLRHEYGHSIQERFMGLSYISTIAVPSVLYYSTYDASSKDASLNYYSMPWERTADWLGQVNRKSGYKNGSLEWGIAENILGPGVIPIFYIFAY